MTLKQIFDVAYAEVATLTECINQCYRDIEYNKTLPDDNLARQYNSKLWSQVKELQEKRKELLDTIKGCKDILDTTTQRIKNILSSYIRDL